MSAKKFTRTAQLAVVSVLSLGVFSNMAQAENGAMTKEPAPAMAPAMAMAPEKTVMVGGAAMYPSKNIVANAVNSKDHTTLVAALKAADLVATLEGPGPFTVFAPTNAAFGKLPAGTVDALLKPENKAKLAGILTYHVVPGHYTWADITGLIKQGNGATQLKTVEGEELTVKETDGKAWIIDSKGEGASVSIADVEQANGVIHVIDTVLMPAK